MGNTKRRLARLEYEWLRYQAEELGLTVDELLQEVEQFFALPLAEQLAEVDQIAAELQAEGMTTDDIDEIKADLTRLYRPTNGV